QRRPDTTLHPTPARGGNLYVSVCRCPPREAKDWCAASGCCETPRTRRGARHGRGLFRSATRDGWDHRDLAARWYGRIKALREPDVFLADVDIHEPAQLAG